jgi:hypothetical protein
LIRVESTVSEDFHETPPTRVSISSSSAPPLTSTRGGEGLNLRDLSGHAVRLARFAARRSPGDGCGSSVRVLRGR